MQGFTCLFKRWPYTYIFDYMYFKFTLELIFLIFLENRSKKIELKR